MKRESRTKQNAYHLTEWPFPSINTFTVVHEKRTTLGKPKIGSSEDLSQAWVLGSVAHKYMGEDEKLCIGKRSEVLIHT